MSYIEAVLARGDRRLADVIEVAWRSGCRFDAWDEHFRSALWLQAMRKQGLDPDFYVMRPREADEVFPWDHIDCGVDKAYLRQEWRKAKDGSSTPECRLFCGDCGAAAYGTGVCYERN